jgi:tetratricopeptide (TPR) repeat protein
MNKKTVGLIALIATIVFCGCPGLMGIMFGFGAIRNDPVTSLFAIGLSLIQVAIPVGVYYLVFRSKSAQTKSPQIKQSNLIQDLRYQSPEVARIKAEIERMERQDPALGMLGAMGGKAAFVGGDQAPALQTWMNLKENLSTAKEGEKNTRANAASKLGESHDNATVDSLITALGDEYAMVRISAIEALGTIGDKRATVHLSKLVQEDKDESVQKKAQEVLEKINPPKLAENNTPLEQVSQNVLRLADPNHPARKQIVDLTHFLNETVKINVFGNNVVYNTPVDFGEAEKIEKTADEGIELSPNDYDMLVAKASVLQAIGQFKTAEETLDIVLNKDPKHFEARVWKDHWETWGSSWKYPNWNEQQTSLHPMMSNQFEHGLAFQVVRDGVQKTIAIVAGGPPQTMDKRTQVKVKWILSKTPYGSIVAYYVRVLDPTDEPHNMEMFLAPRKPSLFTPIEGYFLLEQLAFTPYCFVVLANQEKVTLNRKVVLGNSTIQEVRNITKQLSEQQSYIDESQIKNAYQWHMNNFDMNKLKFE